MLVVWQSRWSVRFVDKPTFHQIQPDFYSIFSPVAGAIFHQRKIYLSKTQSPISVQAKTRWKRNLKPDNSCFENNADVYFLLGPIKVCGSHFVKFFDRSKISIWLKKEIWLVLLQQFFPQFLWIHQFVHVQLVAKNFTGGQRKVWEEIRL